MSSLAPRYNRNVLFWTLHVAGWLALRPVAVPRHLLYENEYEKMAGYITVIVIATVSGFLLSLELRTSIDGCGPARRGRSSSARYSAVTVRAGVARDHQFGVLHSPATR